MDVTVDKHNLVMEYPESKRFIESDATYGIAVVPGPGSTYIPVLAERNQEGFHFYRVRRIGPGVMRYRNDGVKTDFSTLSVGAGAFYPGQIYGVVDWLMSLGFECRHIQW